MFRYLIIFEGRVQGVGFRYTVSQLSHLYGLTGTVKNLDNGNVELQIQGKQESIDAFLSDVFKKKTYIRIDDYQIKKIPLKEESSFSVIY